MKIKIIMDSGKEYEVDICYDKVKDFVEYDLKNQIGVMINSLIDFNFTGRKLCLNPTHISSIEEI